jgi:hypothetical protein
LECGCAHGNHVGNNVRILIAEWNVLGRYAVMNNTKWMPYTDEEVEYLSKPLKPVKK